MADVDDYDQAFNMPKFSVNTVLAWKPLPKLQLFTRLGFYSKQQTSYLSIRDYATLFRIQSEVTSLTEKLMDGSITPEETARLQTVLNDGEQAQANLNVVRNVPAYFLWDIGARYTISKLELGFTVNNVLNRKYAISGACTGLIPQKGCWFLFDVAYKF